MVADKEDMVDDAAWLMKTRSMIACINFRIHTHRKVVYNAQGRAVDRFAIYKPPPLFQRRALCQNLLIQVTTKAPAREGGQ